LSNFTTLNYKSEEVAALLHVTCRREVGIIFKLAPVKNQGGNFKGIIDIMPFKLMPKKSIHAMGFKIITNYWQFITLRFLSKPTSLKDWNGKILLKTLPSA
jgi:hypothetical protein